MVADQKTAEEDTSKDSGDPAGAEGSSKPDQPNPNSEKDVKQASASMAAGSLPIEGESKWISTMRLLAASIVILIFVIAAVFHYLTEDQSFLETNQLAMILGGIIFVLVLEYFVFLLVVIPKQANYGRFVINRDYVDFYPLTSLGLSMSAKARPVKMGRFIGVMTGKKAGKKGKTEYAVYLVHADEKGKTIMVQSFNELREAEHFAAKLGEMLGLAAVSKIKAPPPSA